MTMLTGVMITYDRYPIALSILNGLVSNGTHGDLRRPDDQRAIVRLAFELADQFVHRAQQEPTSPPIEP